MAKLQWARLRKQIEEVLSQKYHSTWSGYIANNFVDLHKELEFMLHDSGLYSKNEISNFTMRLDRAFLLHLKDVNSSYSDGMLREWEQGFSDYEALNQTTGFAFQAAPPTESMRDRILGKDQPAHHESAKGWFTTDRIVGLDLEMQGTIKNLLVSDLFAPQVVNPFKSMEQISQILGITKVAGGDRMIASTGITSRAEKIYRTEAMATQNLAKWTAIMHSAERDPETLGVWIATGDFRTRNSHLQAHGQARSPMELFIVGGETARFPGDPILSARERINCRCTIVPYKEAFGDMEDVFGPINDPIKDSLQAKGLTNQWLGFSPSAIQRPGMFAPVPAVSPLDTALPEGVFPKSYEQLEFVQSLGGTTGARLMVDPKTGRRYVVKTGASPEHLLNEMAADAAYRAAGIRVPAFRRYETPAGPVKVAEFLDGRLLSELKGELTNKELMTIYAQLQEGFAMDAFLGNWDVVGTGFDNILIDAEGVPWRIDNGGAMNFRAMGARKQVDAWVDELWSMRDEAKNPWTYEVFGDMDYEDIHEGIGKVVANYDDMIAAAENYDLDASIFMGLRSPDYQYLWDIGYNMGVTDTFEWEYIDTFSKHFSLLGREGIQDLWSEEMSFPEKPEELYGLLNDEHGKPWGEGYRGSEGGFFTTFTPYAHEQGLLPEIMPYWAESQSQSSWSRSSQAAKFYYANVMSKSPEQDFFWRQGYSRAEDSYMKVVRTVAEGRYAVYDETLTAWHAYNYWSLLETDLPNSDPSGLSITLTRRESKNAMNQAELTRGDTEVTMKRGPLESSYLRKYTEGGEVTTQEVPYHRVFYHYLHTIDPQRGRDSSPLYSNIENEFVFMPLNLFFNYAR